MTRNEGIGAHQHERSKGNRAPGMLADGNCESVTPALHPGAPLCITGKPWQQFTASSPLIIDVSVRPTVGHPPSLQFLDSPSIYDGSFLRCYSYYLLKHYYTPVAHEGASRFSRCRTSAWFLNLSRITKFNPSSHCHAEK